jgi:hypothetical protein
MKMNVKKVLGFAAVGALLVVAAPAERAQATSLISPGIAAAVQDGSQLTTEVRWRRWGGYRRHYGFRRHYGYRRHFWRRHRW